MAEYDEANDVDGSGFIDYTMARMDEVLNEVSAVASGAGDAGSVVVSEAENKIQKLQDQIKILQEQGPDGEVVHPPGESPADEGYQGARHELQITRIFSFKGNTPLQAEMLPKAGGPMSGGNVVVIEGKGFIRSKTVVSIGAGDVQEIIINDNASAIEFIAPASTTQGDVDIKVSVTTKDNDDKDVIKEKTALQKYFYFPDGQLNAFIQGQFEDDVNFVITGVSTLEGPDIGSTRINITGRGFMEGIIQGTADHFMEVHFGSNPATIINVIADRNGEGESVISCDSPPKGTENDEVDIVVIRNGASRLSRMFSEAKFKYTETLTDDNKKEIIDALNDAWNAAKRIIDDKTIENDQRIRADVIKKEVEIYQDERLLIKKEIQTLSNFITEFKKSHMNKDGGFIHHENNTSVSNDSSVNALRQQITFLNGQYTSISNFFSMQEKYEDIIDDKIDPALIHVIQQLKLELDRLRKEINKVDNEIRKIKNLNNDDLATFISEIEQSILQIKNDIKDFENVERRFKITQYRTDFRKHKKQMKNLQREEKLVIDYVSRIQSFHQLATDFINKHNANNFADGEKDRLHSAAEANLIQIKNDLTAMMKLLVDADKKIFEPAEETFKKLERGVGAEITEYYKLKEHGTTLQTKLKDAYGELDEVTPAP